MTNCPKCNAPGEPLLTHICHCRWEALAPTTERKPMTEPTRTAYWREALAACASTNS